MLLGSYMKTQYGLLAVLLVSLIQFIVTGLDALLVLWLRKETLNTDGICRANRVRSLTIASVICIVSSIGEEQSKLLAIYPLGQVGSSSSDQYTLHNFNL